MHDIVLPALPAFGRHLAYGRLLVGWLAGFACLA
jgi:hypothetical protein